MATIKFKRGASDTTGTLAAGEPALNTASSKLWVGVDGTNKKWVGAEIETSPADWTSALKLATQSAINTTFMPKSGGTFSGAINGTDLTLSGDLTVNGTTTNINTTNLVVEDKNIILGDVASPSDTTADGGGITLKGLSDKTFNWVDSTDAWTSSEHMNLASGKAYYINGTSVLNGTTLGTGITTSSLTTVGALSSGSITTGFTQITAANLVGIGSLDIDGFATAATTAAGTDLLIIDSGANGTNRKITVDNIFGGSSTTTVDGGTY